MNRKLKNNELGRLSNEDFKTANKVGVSVILDDIRSLNNIGSVFRSSDAFLIDCVYLCGITAKPPHRDIHKTALGATDTVKWEHHEDAVALVHQLKANGQKVYAIEQAENSVMLDKVALGNEPISVVFGNEVKGVSQPVIDACDGVIEIPQFGTKHSLNIAVSTGIVLWDLSQKKRGPKSS